ncbi:1-acyl-sn-glycerol-3-phosphate acyltransferase [Consotaella salsifontis]|uniref:Putative hemolysin n=1 Tax=Consotaella salsifontis TaxID=1365950 RepID=A0A1T4QU40_9HYPH|nr:1-acyl-sn-glycerol-3-phosphate acyltransferase [Consotaella salsifontis]SKA07137.1 Putative hemolysin [Consotaella salsifontis]
MRHAHLTYSRPDDPPMRRWAIRSMEQISGRGRLAELYERWRERVERGGTPAFGEMLRLMRIDLAISGHWPLAELPQRLVIVANHPFGIGDGAAVLSLAESLGRPFRILIASELMKIPEMAAYGLPVVFSETKEALAANRATRQEALRLLAEGTTIVIFPAGGVATAPRIFGRALDLPWKHFTARLVRSAGASVLPVHVEGQNGPLFHLVSKWSQTLRYGLLIGAFRRLYGRTIRLNVGQIISHDALIAGGGGRIMTESLREAVFALAPPHARPRAWVKSGLVDIRSSPQP